MDLIFILNFILNRTRRVTLRAGRYPRLSPLEQSLVEIYSNLATNPMSPPYCLKIQILQRNGGQRRETVWQVLWASKDNLSQRVEAGYPVINSRGLRFGSGSNS